MNFITLAFSLLFIIGCQTSQRPQLQNIQISSQVEIKKRLEDLEKENIELQMRNSILLQVLKTKKEEVKKLAQKSNQSKDSKTQVFAEFDILVQDQAKTAYEAQDLDRLVEAFRILKSQMPESKYLPGIYIWLSDLQLQKKQYSQALVTLDEFIRSYPKNNLSAKAQYLKGKLYHKLDLNSQAVQVFKSVKKEFPNSQESKLSDSMISQIQSNNKGSL